MAVERILDKQSNFVSCLDHNTNNTSLAHRDDKHYSEVHVAGVF